MNFNWIVNLFGPVVVADLADHDGVLVDQLVAESPGFFGVRLSGHSRQHSSGIPNNILRGSSHAESRAHAHRLSSGCAKRIGTPKLEPPKPRTTAKVTPMTCPFLLMSGPPELPEVVCAS